LLGLADRHSTQEHEMSKHKKAKHPQPESQGVATGQSPVDKEVVEHVHDAPRRDDDDLSVLLSSSNPEQKPKP
jgi:hypothetical protein